MKTITFKDYSFAYVNENTERGKRMLKAYSKATNTDIYKAYKKPSSKKVSSFNKLKEKMEDLDGHGMRITGAGSDQYSCAYIINIDNEPYLIYETSCNSYIVKYSV